VGGFWTEKSLVIFGRNTAWKINKTLRKNGFKEKLSEVFSHYEEQQNACNSGIGTGFSLRVIRRELGNKGQPEDYRAARAWTSQCDGGIREQDRKLSAFHREGNADTFMSRFSSYMNLSRMMDCSGNLAEQFQQTGPKIVLVLDNAAITKLDIREQIVKELPNVVLEFLPASPDFNLIELVWHSCRIYCSSPVQISQWIKRFTWKVAQKVN